MLRFLMTFFCLFVLISPSQARDQVQDFSIADAMSSQRAQDILGSQIRFYFGAQGHGAVSRSFGDFRTNKKTNAFNKSDLEACEWVFLSAMVSLRDRAVREGGNAVVNIRSNYKNRTTTSTETFQCGAGNIMAGVALIGEVVTLAQ